jgi:hypothetical protein
LTVNWNGIHGGAFLLFAPSQEKRERKRQESKVAHISTVSSVKLHSGT